tara:strand:- start:985 stop:1728 length:744 start_codon:yes stop_codon:yes gene_type:complete
MKYCAIAFVSLILIFPACSNEVSKVIDSNTGNSQDSSEEYLGKPEGTEVVRFTTEDGENISGLTFGAGDIGIVLAHMRGRDQSSWYTFAQKAKESGYVALTFDFRGYGESTGTKDKRIDRDLEAAVRYMSIVENVRKVVIIGASMGGAAAIEIADEYNVDAVAALSPPITFGRIDALEAASSMRTPLFLVVAENDPPFNSYVNSFRSTASASRFLTMTGNQHGTNLFADHEEELTEQLLAFVYAHTR